MQKNQCEMNTLTGVLFMKAESIDMGSMNRTMTSPRGSCTPFFDPPRRFLIGSIAPVVLTAYATTSSVATVSMPTLLNPAFVSRRRRFAIMPVSQ